MDDLEVDAAESNDLDVDPVELVVWWDEEEDDVVLPPFAPPAQASP
jgi:hypothetical protein